MNAEWSLDEIYKGFLDPQYHKDLKEAGQLIAKAKELLNQTAALGWKEKTEQILKANEEVRELLGKLEVYVELHQSANTQDGEVMGQYSKILKRFSEYSSVEAASCKVLAEIPDIDMLTQESELIKEYEFFLKENQENAKYLLSDEAEELISDMNTTGGGAWENLFTLLTSTVKVDFRGKEVTLSQIRNLAYSSDEKERKEAYEAELASYEKIQDSVAFALNQIKNQFSMVCERRGYDSPLTVTLQQSRMNRQTLESMMSAIEEYLPVFQKYLKKKAELLGNKGGLPWYNLFAPLGKNSKTYTLEEAERYLVSAFEQLSPDMAELMKEAFSQQWIDFYPRNGKRGGAFCVHVWCTGQSRVLTNYDGQFDSIRTLAHELGHAYHGRQVECQRPMNRRYSMPVAETASTFNEIHLNKIAILETSGEEKINLLESYLMDNTQTIVDIYSRYLFETAFFEQSKEKFLMAEDCKNLMLEAQKKAYGDALDSEYLHPYMWACKNHYYSTDLSFYNFPYAFGNLFALGLYRRYEEEGEAFIPKYRKMLHETTTDSVEHVAALVGIDVTSREFWCQGLAKIAESVEEFCRVEKL